ncbi:bacteriocin-like protein [Chryseobacterium sp. 22543]|uniref:bacteriocin-like protein n=1 Tax=Chryseobacterium sp. 22543 TaxID=3453940 RepID=UPI003F82C5C6
MKNLKKLSREDKRSIVAGVDFPAYCFEGGGPGEGGCSAGRSVQVENVCLTEEIREVEEILAVVVILIPVSVRGELLHSLHHVLNFIV